MAHKDLLGYLVRRLLENGANSSFVNKLADDKTPVEKIIIDPVARVAALASKPHPLIPLPKDIYGDWKNSDGIDLSDTSQYEKLRQQMNEAEKEKWVAASIINGNILADKSAQSITSPSHIQQVIGYVNKASEPDVETAIQGAVDSMRKWEETPVAERAASLERAAELYQEEMPRLIAILNKEAGKCIMDSLSEIRETIDFCRYYAYRARLDLIPQILPGPTGD